MGVVPSVARWRGPDQASSGSFKLITKHIHQTIHHDRSSEWFTKGKNENTNRNKNTASTPPCAKTAKKLWIFLSRSSLFWSGVMRALEVTALVAYLCPFMSALTCKLSWYHNDTEEFECPAQAWSRITYVKKVSRAAGTLQGAQNAFELSSCCWIFTKFQQYQ